MKCLRLNYRLPTLARRPAIEVFTAYFLFLSFVVTSWQIQKLMVSNTDNRPRVANDRATDSSWVIPLPNRVDQHRVSQSVSAELPWPETNAHFRYISLLLAYRTAWLGVFFRSRALFWWRHVNMFWWTRQKTDHAVQEWKHVSWIFYFLFLFLHSCFASHWQFDGGLL